MEDILNNITNPKDLKKLNYEDKKELAEEIRSYIIDVVSKNGGHLASNLGVVELTIALHSIFDTPKDKIIWDVGHQTYVHKILTGRKENFIKFYTCLYRRGSCKRSEIPCSDKISARAERISSHRSCEGPLHRFQHGGKIQRNLQSSL